jgi:hypothetical protein
MPPTTGLDSDHAPWSLRPRWALQLLTWVTGSAGAARWVLLSWQLWTLLWLLRMTETLLFRSMGRPGTDLLLLTLVWLQFLAGSAGVGALARWWPRRGA